MKGEVREGSEDNDKDDALAPMKGKRKGKKKPCKACAAGKNPGCSCHKQMAAGHMDALTVPEYVLASEMGIQNRSLSYIRARLDAEQRADIKCGRGAISKGEKCTKPTSMAASTRIPRAKWSTADKVAAAAGVGGVAVGVGGLLTEAYRGRPHKMSRYIAAIGGGGAISNLAYANAQERAGNKAEANRARGRAAAGALLGGLGAGTAALESATRPRVRSYDPESFKRAKQSSDEFWNRQRQYTREWTEAKNRQWDQRRRSAGPGGQQSSGSAGSSGSSSRSSGSSRRRGAYPGDPYKDLGVNPNATYEEAKRAYRNAAMKNHPDMGGDPEQMKKINNAWEELQRKFGRKDSELWFIDDMLTPKTVGAVQRQREDADVSEAALKRRARAAARAVEKSGAPFYYKSYGSSGKGGSKCGDGYIAKGKKCTKGNGDLDRKIAGGAALTALGLFALSRRKRPGRFRVGGDPALLPAPRARLSAAGPRRLP